MHCKRQKNSRTGFSLVELLVVIAIIAVLVAFMTVAVMSALGNARVQATQALIKKVDGLLRQRIEAFNRFDFNSKFGWATTQKLSEADSIQNRAKVLARKWLFQRYFPQTWYEVQQAGLITQTELTTIQNEMAQSGSTAAESSEVLYFILTQSDLIGYSAEGIDEFKSNEVRDTGCSLRPEFIDAWGQPFWLPIRSELLPLDTTAAGTSLPVPDFARGQLQYHLKVESALVLVGHSVPIPACNRMLLSRPLAVQVTLREPRRNQRTGNLSKEDPDKTSSTSIRPLRQLRAEYQRYRQKFQSLK
jgi:prepilin-type N-terminal cleavage/methylation domain-containing protein